MILGLHHAQITIPKDAEELGRKFYCSLLDLPEIKKPIALQNRGGFWLQVGNLEVHIGTENDFDRLQTKAHIAYLVDDISFWKKKLSDNGVKIIDAIAIPNYERFEFRDPFGNRVEMIQAV